MAKGGGGGRPAKGRNDDRPNGKAWKKAVLVMDSTKRRLVKEPHPKG
jgi:hypothetical protein